MFEKGEWYFVRSPRRSSYKRKAITNKEFWRESGADRGECAPIFQVEDLDSFGNVVKLWGYAPYGSGIHIRVILTPELFQYVEKFTPSIGIMPEGCRYYPVCSGVTDVIGHLGRGYTYFRNFVNDRSTKGESANYIRLESKNKQDCRFSGIRFPRNNRVHCVFDVKFPDWLALMFSPVDLSEAIDERDIVSDEELSNAAKYVINRNIVSDEDIELLDAVKYLLATSGIRHPDMWWSLSLKEGNYDRTTTLSNIIEASNKRRLQISNYRDIKENELSYIKKSIENLKDL